MSLTEVLSSLTKNTWNYQKRACPASCVRIVLCFRKHQTDLMLPEHFGWLVFSYTASKTLFEFGVVMVNIRVRWHSWCINVNECPYKDKPTMIPTNKVMRAAFTFWPKYGNRFSKQLQTFTDFSSYYKDDASLLFSVVTLFPLTLCPSKVILLPFVVTLYGFLLTLSVLLSFRNLGHDTKLPF